MPARIYNAIVCAPVGRRTGHGNRLVKTLFVGVVLFALFAPAYAAARDLRPGFRAWAQEQGGRPTKNAQGQPPRGDRNQRGEPLKGHKGRLTEEERRQLQRDLDRANREIYRK